MNSVGDSEPINEIIDKMVNILNSEFGLPKSVRNILVELNKISWFENIDYSYLPARTCEYIKIYGTVSDLIGVERASLICQKIIGKPCYIVPEITGLFCGVNNKRFIRELNEDELLGFDVCLDYFCSSDLDVLKSFIDGRRKYCNISGVTQVNKVLGSDLKQETNTCKFLEICVDKHLRYYLELAEKEKNGILTEKEVWTLNFARRMKYAI